MKFNPLDGLSEIIEKTTETSDEIVAKLGNIEFLLEAVLLELVKSNAQNISL